MRIIDADAFVQFLKDAVIRQGYENLKIDRLLTVADVIEAIVSELDGTSLDGFKNAPTIEPEPCEDAISRKDAIEKIVSQPPEPHYPDWYAEQIKQLPSVTPQPKTGKWIPIVAELGAHKTIVEGYNCSKCGRYDAERDNFCPACGARMSGGESCN